MREAFHVNNQHVYLIPQDLSPQEIQNHKQNAKKGTFSCPYCQAKLLVRSGPELGNYFAHYHGEGCEPSKQSEKRYATYEKQKKDETPRHPEILAIMLDELEVIAKTYNYITCTRGYLNADFKKYIPDITLKIKNRQYAITIFTNITENSDSTKSKVIQKQRNYYTSLGYEPLFFIERSNLAIDIDHESLVLWKSEKEALSTQESDFVWQDVLNNLATPEEFKKYLKIPDVALEIKSIMYITPAKQNIAVQTFHVIPLSTYGPPKVYFLATPYTLTFSEAFKINNNQLMLANKAIEKQHQDAFVEKFNQAKERYLSEQKCLEEYEKQMEEKFRAEEERRRAESKARQEEYLKAQQNSSYQKADKESKLDLLRKAFNSNN